jgi:Zn-dependent peptidase ImmA (M78 family)
VPKVTRVKVRPELLRWARERAGLEAGELGHRFPALERWEQGEGRPTLKQLERFANAVHVPVGYLFLGEPPVEQVPIPDLRTVGNERLRRPSPDLLETVYICQQRQEWYREFSRSEGDQPHAFVGSARPTSDVEATAASIRRALNLDLEAQRRTPTWTDALRSFIDHADILGILVMCSGVVLNDSHRHLNPDEFRGFAMADGLAPLVFINGADSKAAQMFTLAHELAHIWLGQSGVSDAQAAWMPKQEVERWCNRVAAELLVPLEAVRNEYRGSADLDEEVDRLAGRFKVSPLVVLRRIHDAGGLTWEQLRVEYAKEAERLRSLPKRSGGNFYLSMGARVSKRFARAMVSTTLGGQGSFTEAFRLLGIKKLATLHDLGTRLGVTV